jgi:hypothetical protein
MSASDEARVCERFKEVFGDTRSSYLQHLLQELPTRGLSNVLSDIEEARASRSKQPQTPGWHNEHLAF